MFWKVVYQKVSPRPGNECMGVDVDKTTFFTSSVSKQRQISEKYKQKGFFVKSECVDEPMPSGYECRTVVSNYWLPLSMNYNMFLQLMYKDAQSDFEKPKKEKPPKEKIGECNHIFNCTEHKEICVLRGHPEITTEFPSKK